MVSVVHEGVLKLGRKPSSNSSKDWKHFLFVLKHHQDTKRLYLDYYKDANKRWQKQEKKGSIEVLSYCHFSLAHNCSYLFPLKVTTASDGDLFLAATTFESMNTWYNSLQQHCYLIPSATGYYEFLLVPRESTSTKLIGASGDCVLAFTPQKHIVCAQQSTRQVFGVWPYSSLRKYWGDKKAFGFICGRRAPRGEGEFTFQTKQGEDIFIILERLIKVVSARPLEVPVLASAPLNITRGRAPGLGNTAAEEGGTDRDIRVQQPLPPQVHPKPPELRKRLSLAEPLPPTPGQSTSSPTPPRVPTDSIPSSYQQHPANTTIISDTSPAYCTAPLVLSRPMSHVHQSPSPPSQGALQEVPPMRRGLPVSSPPTSPTKLSDQEEDTYSHTSHDVPLQFARRNASFKVMQGDSIYHGLVRSDSLGSKKDRVKRESESSSPDLDSMAMYDLAYRPCVQNPRELVPVLEGEYESVGDAARQMLQLKEKDLPVRGNLGNGNQRNRGESLSFGEKLRYGEDSPDWSMSKPRAIVQHLPLADKQNVGGGKDDEDTRQKRNSFNMTDNPMYGSRENIFSDSITDTASSINRERERSASGGSGSGQGQEGHGQEHSEQVMTDMERSMVMNPVYNECRPSKNRPDKLMGFEEGGVFPGFSVGEQVQRGDDEPLSPLEDSMVDNPMYGGRNDLAGIGQLNGIPQLAGPNRSGIKNAYEESSNPDKNAGGSTTENPPDLAMEASSCSPPSSQNQSCSPASSAQTAIPIARSTKGYTKVDKLAAGTPQTGEAGSPPPPLPPRLYSESNA